MLRTEFDLETEKFQSVVLSWFVVLGLFEVLPTVSDLLAASKTRTALAQTFPAVTRALDTLKSELVAPHNVVGL